MSSFTRTIQRSSTRRAPNYMGRGSKLGVNNPKAKDLLARQKRTPAWRFK